MDKDKQKQACKDEAGEKIILRRNDMDLFKQLAQKVAIGHMPPLENCAAEDFKDSKNKLSLPMPVKPAGKTPAQ